MFDDDELKLKYKTLPGPKVIGREVSNYLIH